MKLGRWSLSCSGDHRIPKCQDVEISVTESCKCDIEPTQREAVCTTGSRAEECGWGMWLPRWFYHKPQVPDIETQHLLFARLGFALAVVWNILAILLLFILAMEMLILCQYMLEVCCPMSWYVGSTSLIFFFYFFFHFIRGQVKTLSWDLKATSKGFCLC